MSSLRFRAAGPDDAERVADLHADSWRRHYRGAYADSFLDGDVATERRAVWSATATRHRRPNTARPAVAEHRTTGSCGFVHVMFDQDPKWGSLVDNLHVHHGQHRTGIGTQLLAHAAQAVTEGATGNAIYLWVLEQNTAAQKFYFATGATCVETATVPPPGGDPTRLNGTPSCLLMAWPDASRLSRSDRANRATAWPLPLTGPRQPAALGRMTSSLRIRCQQSVDDNLYFAVVVDPRSAAGQSLLQGLPKRVEVHRCGDGLARLLLRRRVAERADRMPRRLERAEPTSGSEVDQDRPGVAQDDVVRLEIQVRESALVQRHQRREELGAEQRDLRRIERAVLVELVRQRRPVDVLDQQVRDRVVGPVGEEPRQRGVKVAVQRCGLAAKRLRSARMPELMRPRRA